MWHAAVTGWGMYVPERVLSNADLSQMVDTSDEWIVSRTGIRERRVAAANETATSMAVSAARNACATAGLDPAELDLIVVGTYTPDQYMPSVACLVQRELGAIRAGAFDVNAACSGFVYALSVGAQFVQTGVYAKVLVIGADIASHFLDYTDRGTCILFGDGAGAVVIEASDHDEGLMSIVLGSDGRAGRHLTLASERSYATLNGGREIDRPFMRMNGPEVYRFAVRVMGEAAADAVHKAGLTFSDIDLLVPHQANLRIIDAAAKRLELPREKVWVNVAQYGNTSSASVPICLVEAVEAGAIQDGMNIVVVAFGGGLTWAAGVLRWGSGGVARVGRT
ncbi:MAG TPA: beta-ketoacyl-ACP synthase III [Thermomicrobiales bacterium]|nr:beta-ketoacyl-ACP synthase III [Thermomicrobiales bacterium]